MVRSLQVDWYSYTFLIFKHKYIIITDGDYEEFAKNYHDKAIFARVDCDENEDAAQEFAIDSMPTFICFMGGEKIDDVKGAKIEKIKAFFNKHLA